VLEFANKRKKHKDTDTVVERSKEVRLNCFERELLKGDNCIKFEQFVEFMNKTYFSFYEREAVCEILVKTLRDIREEKLLGYLGKLKRCEDE